MEPQDLAKAIESLVLNADSRYVSAIGRIQNKLYDELVVILILLALDPQGYILQNAINRKVLTSASEKINEVFTSNQYVTSINNYISLAPKIDLLNVKYFTGIEESFKPNRIFLKNLQNETVATLEKYVLRDGLQSQVIDPLKQILNQNINSGGKFSGFLDQIRTYIKGNEQVEGRAMSYTRTYVRNVLFQYSRAYQESITSDLGLDWYLYSGGLIDTSREFCRERNGHYYHRKEVESWASLTWRGKAQGTTESSIFILLGGHGCVHFLIPVHLSVVPKEDQNRI